MSVERTLHHFPLDPASRQVRLVLGEKRLAFEEVQVRYWERPKSLTALNPPHKAKAAATPSHNLYSASWDALPRSQHGV